MPSMDLVQHERVVGAAPDGEALLVAQAGLLDVDVDVAHGADHPRRLVHQPAGVGVGDQHVAALAARAATARMRVDVVVRDRRRP